jgi:hypothetical protein
VCVCVRCEVKVYQAMKAMHFIAQLRESCLPTVLLKSRAGS